MRRTTPAEPAAAAEGPETEEIAAVPAAEREPGSWDPVPVTLPTYVDKAEAARSVRTIDLDSTGVWSSGRNESDSALAREADEASRAAKAAEAAEQSGRRLLIRNRRVPGATVSPRVPAGALGLWRSW